MVLVSGWSTYSNYVSITSDNELSEIRALLKKVKNTIHEEKTKICDEWLCHLSGCLCTELIVEAKNVAEHIGKVHVDVGNSVCKIPLAKEYIEKVESKDRVGVKRKTCICKENLRRQA
ncbi:hypothetical protein DFO70_110184 [Cytobacillus firmus]|uniref:Uncharacterized protein n=2 Tax=Cytobacillus TaxID=2675230 RepID=A0A366JPR0_CYTFI|nr:MULTISPECIES: hypothetical protein [Cytobacillus]RBP90078.1 hypothetical protein DFO70_110184 [Cytobacillus firmus]TDX40526.1 hypothetical protein DFO72_109195 [Cytobacillus oceanisediminis]